MHRYFIKTPWIVRRLFPGYLWRMPNEERAVYLTFDDGPHPEITPWVLSLLKSYGAKGSFFCIGSNVQRYPQVYRQILEEGHAVGNHTYSHPRGWNTENKAYLEDVQRAAGLIDSCLFRPPYGRIRPSQARGLAAAMGRKSVDVVMWDVLSADFDPTFSPEQCLGHVTRHTEAGSVVVFHDSEKAYKNLKLALPGTLEFLASKGFQLKSLPVAGFRKN